MPPRPLRHLVPVVAAALALAVPGTAPAAETPCPDGSLKPSPTTMDRVSDSVVCLLNKERTKRGLSALREHPTLDRVATIYSRLMVRETFFSHESPGGSTMVGRVRRTSYLKGTRGWSLGENIAWATGSLATPANTVRAWMNSAGHRANILNRGFEEIGIGVAYGAPVQISASQTAATYTTNFGRRDG